jgi:sigma-B regulation protein RsbU (phosphoserine phosphatase)
MNKLEVFLNTVSLAFASVRLFEGLEEKVRQRTAQLNKANEEAKELNRKLEEVNKEMKRERKVASQIQQAIVPKVMPKEEAMKIGYFWVPMTEVSGDYFDVISIGGGKYGILIADVSGHGVPSALITTMAKIAFINHSKPDVTTAEICTLVNKEIYAALGDIGFYLTAFYGIFDVNTRDFVFTNAGHQPSYWYQKSTDQIVELDSPGFFIGSFDGAEYGHNTVTLEAGDKVIFFTDGIVEARNQAGEFFEDQRLRDFIRKHKNTGASEMANGLINYVEEFAEGRSANDDRTAVILEVAGSKKSTGKADDVQSKDKKIAEFVNYFNIGARAAKEEKYEDALDAFEKALEISPSSAQVYINMGHVYRKQKSYEKAKDMYEKALGIKDNLVEAHNSLGVVYFYMKDFDNAVKAFEATLKLNPKLKSASDNLKKIKQLLDR